MTVKSTSRPVGVHVSPQAVLNFLVTWDKKNAKLNTRVWLLQEPLEVSQLSDRRHSKAGDSGDRSAIPADSIATQKRVSSKLE